MRTKMTIHSLDIRKSKAGDSAIQITAKTDDGKFATEWFGSKAPDAVVAIWTNALGSNPLDRIFTVEPWHVLSRIDVVSKTKIFQAKVVTSDYGLKMEDVCHLATPEPKTETKPEPKTETKTETNPEIDFSDLPTEPKEEVKKDEIPF